MRWQVGKVKICRVVETELQLPLDGLLPGIGNNEINKHRHWLAPHFIDANNKCSIVIQALVIEAAQLRIVVDTCIGEHDTQGSDMLDLSGSRFLEKLAALGYPADTITHVLCTHMHFDHIGWNTRRVDGAWVPTFPNARYLFAKKEFDHWHNEPASPYTTTFNDAVVPIVEAGLADLVAENHKLCDTVQLVSTPGHSPGHVSVLIRSQQDQALITGDATHHPIQWAELDWPMMADYDSAQAARSRRWLVEQFSGSTLVIGTHYPDPVAGYLQREEDGIYFRTDDNHATSS